MVPNRIIGLDNIPFNQSGKVDRKALQQLLEDSLNEATI
jgi:acyl-CoA synthetase (AMP-forming)/AMP-acid ligase II